MFWSLAKKATVAIGFLLLFLSLASPALAAPVPEINPGSAVSAITLLAGGVLLLADKFRIRK